MTIVMGLEAPPEKSRLDRGCGAPAMAKTHRCPTTSTGFCLSVQPDRVKPSGLKVVTVVDPSDRVGVM